MYRERGLEPVLGKVLYVHLELWVPIAVSAEARLRCEGFTLF